MTDNLVTFYKDIFRCLRLKEKNGVVYVRGENKDIPMLIDGKPVALPTKEHIDTVIRYDGEEPEVTKYIFNPLDENAVKGENKAFIRIKETIERLASVTFGALGVATFSILADEDQDISNTNFIEFIKDVFSYKRTGIKKIVDEKTIENWKELVSATKNLGSRELFVHIFLKRGGKIGDVRYNRLANLYFPIFEKLTKADGNTPFYDIKIRNKDIHVYKAYYKHHFCNEDMNPRTEEELLNGILFGSSNKVAPGFVTLMRVYDYISNMNNRWIEMLIDAGFSEDDLSIYKLEPLPFKIEEIENIIDNLINELREVPSENDIELLMSSGHMVNQPIEPSQPVVTQVNKVTTNQQPQEEEDDVLSILGQGPVPQPIPGPTYQMQQQMPQPVYQEQVPQPSTYQQLALKQAEQRIFGATSGYNMHQTQQPYNPMAGIIQHI